MKEFIILNNILILIDYKTASKILGTCNSVTNYFKVSHICNNLLTESAKILKIEGDGLKTFIKTRWTSMYEATYLIVKMRRALDKVIFLIYLKYIFN